VSPVRHHDVSLGEELFDLAIGDPSLSKMIDVDVVPLESFDRPRQPPASSKYTQFTLYDSTRRGGLLDVRAAG
jgi:hypothetical protein